MVRVSTRNSESPSNHSDASFQIPFCISCVDVSEHLCRLHRRAYGYGMQLFCLAVSATKILYAIQNCRQIRSRSMRSLPHTSGLRYAPAAMTAPLTHSVSLQARVVYLQCHAENVLYNMWGFLKAVECWNHAETTLRPGSLEARRIYGVGLNGTELPRQSLADHCLIVCNSFSSDWSFEMKVTQDFG